MALKGVDIFRLTPKKNCKECGSPTCMAFAMKVAQGAASIDKCPHMSGEALAKLSEATAPIMKTISVGTGENAHTLGGETVLFRHEKTLVNKNIFAGSLSSDMTAEVLDARIAAYTSIDYERINEREYVELLNVRYAGNGVEAYVAAVEKASAANRTLILECTDPEAAKAALSVCKAGKPILNGANRDNFEAMNAIATEAGVTLGVCGANMDELYDTILALEAKGNKNLIIDVTGANAKETYANAVLVRRTNLREENRSLGYPSLVNVGRISGGDEHTQTALAAAFTLKYGSILVVDRFGYPEALALYGLRQNIYTDPQKPMKVNPGLYPLNGADENAPCALTVDFALTYFLVSGEFERSKCPVNLLITDASGMSVLTAWAAGKLSAGSIRAFFDEQHIAERVKSRTLIIPGKVAVMKREIEAKLPEWNVVVGPMEAVQLPKYMKGREYEAAAALSAAEKTNAPIREEERELTFEELLVTKVPKIERIQTDVRYKGHNPDSRSFVIVGERIHCIAPSIRKAMDERDPAPILKRAEEQIAAGATYLDVNIGPAETDGPQRMMWAVKLLQENFDNVPLALDTANKRAIEAGIHVYNRTNGKPIINSADAGSRISYIDLAAANDAICIALCSKDGIAKDNEERMAHCRNMLEHGLRLGMEATDLWFDPLFLVVKGMQDKQMDVLNAIRMFSEEGLKSTGGLSNNSNGMPKAVRPIMDSAMIAMCMTMGLTSAIVNPCDRRLMETIKSCDIIKNHTLYADSYLEL